MATEYADGSIQYGTPQNLTIGGVAGWVLRDWKVERPSNRIVSRDNKGRPLKKAHTDELITATGTLQFPTASTAAPERYLIIAVVPAGGGAAKNWVIESVGETFEQMGETVAPITCSEKLSA